MWHVVELQNVEIYRMHAVEEVLYNKVREGTLGSTIILSTVKPGISISSHQNYFLDVDAEACARDHVTVTRRKSGGRSMYFDNNYLILSVIQEHNEAIDINRHYVDALGQVMRALSETIGKPVTLFNKDDLVVDSRKIGGAAQKNSRTHHLVHCYIRVGDTLEKMLHYLRIGGIPLHPFMEELRPQLTTISEYTNPQTFYERFKQAMIGAAPHETLDLVPLEEAIRKAEEEYTNPAYVHGERDYDVKGHCDIITGSRDSGTVRLKIKSLEGKVQFK